MLREKRGERLGSSFCQGSLWSFCHPLSLSSRSNKHFYTNKRPILSPNLIFTSFFLLVRCQKHRRFPIKPIVSSILFLKIVWLFFYTRDIIQFNLERDQVSYCASGHRHNSEFGVIKENIPTSIRREIGTLTKEAKIMMLN